MSIRILEAFRFRKKDTWLHSLDPRTKFLLLMLFTSYSLGLSDPVSLLIILLTEAAMLYSAQSLENWFYTLRGLVTILALIFILNLLTVTEDRLYVSSAMTLRFLTLTTAFSIFFLTTTPDEVATALEASGVSRDFTLMFSMSLRFVPTLARDLQIIMDALRSRGLELEKGGIRDRIRNYSYLLIPLIVYELRRSLMIAEALEARGFGYTKRVETYYTLTLGRRDYIVIGIFAASIIMLLLIHYLGYYTLFTEIVKKLFTI